MYSQARMTIGDAEHGNAVDQYTSYQQRQREVSHVSKLKVGAVCIFHGGLLTVPAIYPVPSGRSFGRRCYFY